jgi:hypothetical protein
MARVERLLNRKDMPVQIIFAGRGAILQTGPRMKSSSTSMTSPAAKASAERFSWWKL